MFFNHFSKRSATATLVFASGLPLRGLIGFALAGMQPGEGSPAQMSEANGAGPSSVQALGAGWERTGPEILWRIPLGEGFSGLTVADGRVFTLYNRGEQEYAVALKLTDGTQVWRTRTDSIFENESGNGPRSTPVVDEGRVFCMTGQSKLYALRAESGEVIWRHDLVEEYDAVIPFYGTSSTPLIEGDLVIVHAGGRPDQLVIAFAKSSGKRVWSSQNDKEPGYSTPIALTIGGRRQIISLTGSALLSLAPDDGHLHWSFPWNTLAYVNAARPVFVPDDKIFISSSYDMGAALLQIVESGDAPGPQVVWRSRVMRNHFASSVYQDGYLYGFDNSTLKCIAAQTGEQQWAKRGLGRGTLIGADGFLVVLSEGGEVVLIEATASGYHEMARAQVLQGRCFTAPLLARGKLLLRNESELVCLDFS